jgi:hypothetical protein
VPKPVVAPPVAPPKSAPHRNVEAAVRRLVKAEVADSWKGGGDPADVPEIEAELKSARRALRNLLERIFS